MTLPRKKESQDDLHWGYGLLIGCLFAGMFVLVSIGCLMIGVSFPSLVSPKTLRVGLIVLWGAMLLYSARASQRWFGKRSLSIMTSLTYVALAGSYLWFTIDSGKFFLLFYRGSF